MIILYLTASNDVNGNPRRLYLVMDTEQDGSIDAVVDEGYRGKAKLRELYPDATLSPMYRINVPVSEYNDWWDMGKQLEIAHDS